MTIDKAIELLKNLLDYSLDSDTLEAIKLGREGLKRARACRHEYGCPLIDPEGPPEDIIATLQLPGETED